MNKHYITCLHAVFMSGLLVAASHEEARANPPDPDTRINAVWKAEKLSFEYRSGGTYYTCRSLQRKIEKVLLAAGARDGVEVRSRNCADLAGSVSYEVNLSHPVEATPAAIASITDYDSKEVLVARLRGERLLAPEDVERFPAAWTAVSLTRSGGMQFGGGDCELLRQLRNQVLPLLSVRIISDDTECSSILGRSAPPRLVVMTLVPQFDGAARLTSID